MNRAQRRAKTHGGPPRDYVVDYSWRMLFAATGIVLHNHGVPDDEIADWISEIQLVTEAEVDAGGNASTIIQKLEDLTGIALRRKEGRHDKG